MTKRYAGYSCPVDPAHGRVLDWTGSRWGWLCPHIGHDAHGGRPATRSFFTTEEVERGTLGEVPEVVLEPRRRAGAV